MTVSAAGESGPGAPLGAVRSLADWLVRVARLTKARLSTLVLVTTAVGFILAEESVAGFGTARFLWTLLGTALAAAAANALNQIIEVERDAAMDRTRRRPLPAGEMSRLHAAVIAAACTVGGLVVLVRFVNPAAAGLALLTIVVYALVYTPLKVRTTLNTLVGAACGAFPPMIGWIASTGTIDAGAIALGGLLFVWQIPHFLALAWLYREDYARGRFIMLPVHDPSGRLTGQIVILTSLMLVPLALTVTLLGLAGWIFTVGSAALGLWMAALGIRLYRRRTNANARRVFLASIAYLTAVMALLVLDRGPVGRTGIYELSIAGSPPPAVSRPVPPDGAVQSHGAMTDS